MKQNKWANLPTSGFGNRFESDDKNAVKYQKLQSTINQKCG